MSTNSGQSPLSQIQSTGRGTVSRNFQERIDARIKPHEVPTFIETVGPDGEPALNLGLWPIRPYQVYNRNGEAVNITSVVDASDWDTQAKRVKSLPARIQRADGTEVFCLVEVRVLIPGKLPGAKDQVSPTAGQMRTGPSDKVLTAPQTELSEEDRKALGVVD